MTTRILGPTESRRRRRFLLAPILLLTLVALFMAAGAQAVHDVGLFQLDKDATTLESPPVSGEDWDLICKAHQPSSTPAGTCVFAPLYTQPTGTTTADPSSFVVDPSQSQQDDILKGGTKDDNDIDEWKWASAKPSPPKNDITDGYAAEYVCDNDDVGTDNCTGADGDKILYFGADRFSNNGSANLAFWFLQNPVSKASAGADGTCGAGAGCPFTGLHTEGNVSLGGSLGTGCTDPDPGNICTPGDILIISAFGPKAAINIYEWVGEGNATNPPGPGGCFTQNCSLEPLFVGGQACEDVTDDNACATVNDVVTPSPWLLNQSNGPPNSFQPTNFFEGGLNLTQLGVDACFSTFVINTRSSAAGDAELHDLILGQFARCEPALTTQASTNGEVTPGTAVHDTATVTVTGAGNPDDATGTVDFFLCADTVAPFVAPDCSDGGTAAGADIPLVDTSSPLDPDDGVSGANSSDVNTGTSPLAPGAYCFRAEADLTNYADPAEFTNTTTECFTVAKLPTTTVTTPVDGSGTPLTTITLGSSIFDKAVVEGSAAGGDPTGTVNFFICGPLDAPATCDGTTNVGSPVTGNPVTCVPDGTTPPNDTSYKCSATSGAVMPSPIGRYCFRAVYSGNGIYDSSSDSTTGECFTVTTTSSGSSVQNWLPNDHIEVSTATGANLTGSLDIDLRSGSCTGTVVYQEPAPYDGSVTTVTAPINVDTTNSTFKVSKSPTDTTGTYFWRIVFTPNSAFATGFTKCETSTVSINDNP